MDKTYNIFKIAEFIKDHFSINQLIKKEFNNIFKYIKNKGLIIVLDKNNKIIFYEGDNEIKNELFNKKIDIRNLNYFIDGKLNGSLFYSEDQLIGIKRIREIISKLNISIKHKSISIDLNNKINFFLLFPYKNNDVTIIFDLFVKSIEREIDYCLLNKRLGFAQDILETITSSIDDGFIWFNKDAKILFMNKIAGEMLNIDSKKCIGKNVKEIVDFEPVILSVFKNHIGYIDKEFRIQSPTLGDIHFIKSAIVLKDEDDSFNGVLDFFRKIDRVKKFVTNYIGAKAKFKFKDIIGESSKIKEALRIANIASKSKSNILIYGETGTGKEMFAQAIHYEGNRRKYPFIGINCGAIPRDLAESEFFGYEPGAFTGASKNGRPGKFELADHGTIFLDEIGELPILVQTKLLRVIQTMNVYRIGSLKPINIDVRIISATNKDLYKEINNNSFRKDLFYRLNVIMIKLPPLRERLEDLPILINHFIEKISIILKRNVLKYDKSFIEPLYKYDFPGNIRELENIIERAINISNNNVLTAKDLPEVVLNYGSKSSYKQDNLININYGTYNRNKVKYNDFVDLKELKTNILKDYFYKTNGNISKIARLMNISRPTVYKMLKELNLK